MPDSDFAWLAYAVGYNKEMSYKLNPPSEQALHSRESHDFQAATIQRSIEAYLVGKVVQPVANAVVEEVLFDQALRHNLVYDARNIAAELERDGFFVTLQYCNARAVGHPVPFLVVRTDSGESVVPNLSALKTTLHGTELTIIECGTHRSEAANDDRAASSGPGAVVIMPVARAA
jgi:hypothetical protein